MNPGATEPNPAASDPEGPAAFWRLELIPDPRGFVGFAMVMGVLCSHLALPALSWRLYLWSENPTWEVLGHIWLLLGPPLGVYLGLRNLIVARDSVLPLVSVPVGSVLSLLTCASLVVAFFLS